MKLHFMATIQAFGSPIYIRIENLEQLNPSLIQSYGLYGTLHRDDSRSVCDV